jgi:hypothetical protein
MINVVAKPAEHRQEPLESERVVIAVGESEHVLQEEGARARPAWETRPALEEAKNCP